MKMPYSLTHAAKIVASMRNVSLSLSTPLPVYLVHRSINPEDYAFFFDMEAYAQASSGYFTRPNFKVYSGTLDISPVIFSEKFRDAFVKCWNDKKAGSKVETSGGFSDIINIVDAATIVVVTGGSALVPLLFIWAGLSATDSVLSFAESIKDRAKSLVGMGEKKLFDIDEKKSEIDQSLRKMKISLHPDLFINYHGPRSDAAKAPPDFQDTWPLPDNVMASLDWSRSDMQAKALQELAREGQKWEKG